MSKHCPNCGRNIYGARQPQAAAHANKKFCGPTCKDRYHNRVNPRGRAVRPYKHWREEALLASEEGWDSHKAWTR